MNGKKIIIRIVLILLIVGLLLFLGVKTLLSDLNLFSFNEKKGQEIEIVQLEENLRMDTGDYLVLENQLYQKALDTTKELKKGIDLYQQNQLTYNEFVNMVSQSNKKLTYYYLVSLQNNSTEVTHNISNEINYNFYLMRRGSEETLKFLSDGSSLRLSVGSDLLSQAIIKENDTNGMIATALVKYNIDKNSVVISQEIWDKEYVFVSQQPDLVIFKDLNSPEKAEYTYYLKQINEGFLLVSWEMQNIYLDKIDYVNNQISADQLSSSLDKSGFIIKRIYDEFNTLKAPNGLENLEEDTKKTVTMYKDALLEIQKFRMSNDLKYFDNAMLIINQADEEAGRIGEFIYSIRNQYNF